MPVHLLPQPAPQQMLLRLWQVGQATSNIFLLQSRSRDKVTWGNTSPLPYLEYGQLGHGWAQQYHGDGELFPLSIPAAPHTVTLLQICFIYKNLCVDIFTFVNPSLLRVTCCPHTQIWLQHMLHAGRKLMDSPAAAQHWLCSKGQEGSQFPHLVRQGDGQAAL